jgi:hypothetical protein
MSAVIDAETGLRRVRATLTVKVNYEADPAVTDAEISSQLERIAQHAAGDGWLSNNLGETEVEQWEAKATIGPVKPKLTPTQVLGSARRLQVRLASAGLALSQDECAALVRESLDLEPVEETEIWEFRVLRPESEEHDTWRFATKAEAEAAFAFAEQFEDKGLDELLPIEPFERAPLLTSLASFKAELKLLVARYT